VYARRVWGWEWMRARIPEVIEVKGSDRRILSWLVCWQESREMSCLSLVVRIKEGWWRERRSFWSLGEIYVVSEEDMRVVHSCSKVK
jgi:hypothetical protein